MPFIVEHMFCFVNQILYIFDIIHPVHFLAHIQNTLYQVAGATASSKYVKTTTSTKK